jgi:hypothetical protein
MRLDVAWVDPAGHHPSLPGLGAMRDDLSARFARVGPIFA